MAEKVKINNKDKLMFWSGLSIGIVSGIIGNLWVGYVFKITESPKDIYNWIGMIIYTIILFGILIFIDKQISKIKKQ